MNILDHFDLNVSAQITRIVETNDGFDNVVKTPTVVTTIDCLFWEGGTNEVFKSDRFKEDITATIAMAPGTDIQAKDLVTLDSRNFHVLGIDNIGLVSEVLVAYLQEKT